MNDHEKKTEEIQLSPETLFSILLLLALNLTVTLFSSFS